MTKKKMDLSHRIAYYTLQPSAVTIIRVNYSTYKNSSTNNEYRASVSIPELKYEVDDIRSIKDMWNCKMYQFSPALQPIKNACKEVSKTKNILCFSYSACLQGNFYDLIGFIARDNHKMFSDSFNELAKYISKRAHVKMNPLYYVTTDKPLHSRDFLCDNTNSDICKHILNDIRANSLTGNYLSVVIDDNDAVVSSTFHIQIVTRSGNVKYDKRYDLSSDYY